MESLIIIVGWWVLVEHAQNNNSHRMGLTGTFVHSIQEEGVGKRIDSLFFAGELLRVHPSRLVASLITAGAVPIAQHAYRHGKQDVRDDERQDQVAQIVVPGVARDHVFWVGATVEARKRFALVLVAGGRNKGQVMFRTRPSKAISSHPNSLANSVQLTLGGYPHPSELISSLVSPTSQLTVSRIFSSNSWNGIFV